MRTATVTHFKAHCLAMLDDVARTGETLVLVRRGKPIARVIASSSALTPASPPQRLAGTVEILGDLLAPVLDADAWDANRGEMVTTTRPRKRSRTR